MCGSWRESLTQLNCSLKQSAWNKDFNDQRLSRYYKRCCSSSNSQRTRLRGGCPCSYWKYSIVLQSAWSFWTVLLPPMQIHETLAGSKHQKGDELPPSQRTSLSMRKSFSSSDAWMHLSHFRGKSVVLGLT